MLTGFLRVLRIEKRIDLPCCWHRKLIGSDIRYVSVRDMDRHHCQSRGCDAAKPHPVFAQINDPANSGGVVLVEFAVKSGKHGNQRIPRRISRLEPLKNWPGMGAIADHSEAFVPDEALICNIRAIRGRIRTAGSGNDPHRIA